MKVGFKAIQVYLWMVWVFLFVRRPEVIKSRLKRIFRTRWWVLDSFWGETCLVLCKTYCGMFSSSLCMSVQDNGWEKEGIEVGWERVWGKKWGEKGHKMVRSIHLSEPFMAGHLPVISHHRLPKPVKLSQLSFVYHKLSAALFSPFHVFLERYEIAHLYLSKMTLMAGAAPWFSLSCTHHCSTTLPCWEGCNGKQIITLSLSCFEVWIEGTGVPWCLSLKTLLFQAQHVRFLLVFVALLLKMQLKAYCKAFWQYILSDMNNKF